MQPSKKTKQTDRFSARGSDGKNYVVVELTEFQNVTNQRSTSIEWLEVQKEYRLSTGGAVSYVSPTEFTVVATGIRLTKLQ